MSLSPSRTKCSLLALPPEIRTVILTALLCRRESVELYRRKFNKLSKIQGAFTGTQAAPSFVFMAPSQRLSSQILRVCAKVYEEGSRLLYGQNNFDLRETDTTMVKRAQVTAKNLAIIRRVKMSLRTLLCLDRPLEAFSALQRVEIAVGVHVNQTAGCLNYNDVSLREHARLSIRKPNIENAFAILCTKHPKPQVMFTGHFFDFYKVDPIRKVNRPAWRNQSVTDLYSA
jgi:hypothetical protein